MFQEIPTVTNSDPFELIKKADIVSFDVFDTAVVRPFLHHHEMYHIIEKLLNFPKFHNARVKAELFTRNSLINTSHTKEEVTVLDIYEHIHIEKQKAINTEIMFDIEICRQRKFVYHLYQFAVNSGKKVIFTSDITYPTKAIADILHKNGYTTYEKIYVSAEHNLSKHQGGMYKKIISEMQTIPRKILHIGDSLAADVHQARKYGLRPLYIPRPYHCIQKAISESQYKLRTTLLNSALFGCASNVVFNNPSQNGSHRLLLAFPFIYKLANIASKTEGNVFLINAKKNNPVFNIFERVYTLLHGQKPAVVHVNINHVYASCVRTFEDMENIYSILPQNDFKDFLGATYNIHNIANIEGLRKHWNHIEMENLRIRQGTLESLELLPELNVYNFTMHENIKTFAQIALNKEIKNFKSIHKLLKGLISHETRWSIIGKPKVNFIIEEISSLTNKDVQTIIMPQVEQFFSTLGKYINLL